MAENLENQADTKPRTTTHHPPPPESGLTALQWMRLSYPAENRRSGSRCDKRIGAPERQEAFFGGPGGSISR
ncbi:MAG: hypothetical protein ACYTEW_26725, partial [Planctomycetota bacterium]